MPKKAVMKPPASKRTLNPTGEPKSRKGQEPKEPINRDVGQFTDKGNPSLQKE